MEYCNVTKASLVFTSSELVCMECKDASSVTTDHQSSAGSSDQETEPGQGGRRHDQSRPQENDQSVSGD